MLLCALEAFQPAGAEDEVKLPHVVILVGCSGNCQPWDILSLVPKHSFCRHNTLGSSFLGDERNGSLYDLIKKSVTVCATMFGDMLFSASMLTEKMGARGLGELSQAVA
jgi:hypothetical protein